MQGLFSRQGGFSNAVFSFAVSYVRDHPDLEVEFSLSRSDLDAVYESLPGFGAPIDRSDYDAAERFVRYHLEREIALQAWDDAGEFAQLKQYDRQLKRALEILSGVETPEQLLAAIAVAEADPAPR